MNSLFKCLVLASTLFLRASSACSEENIEFISGSIAPSFSSKIISGEEISLAEFRGKKVLLHFWATSCFVCPTEIRTLNNLQKMLDSNLVSVVSILSFDHSKKSKPQAEAMKLTFPVIDDFNDKLAADYDVRILPATFVIDENGRFAEIKDPDNLGKKSFRFDGPRDWMSEMALRSLREGGLVK
jgi:peroxiredoxin